MWLEIWDSRFRIRDSRLKKKIIKMYFKKKVPTFRISKYVSPIVLLQTFCFTQKFALSYAGAFHENSLSVACCIFVVIEVKTIIPNRFKNQSSGTLKILAHDCNHQQGLAKQKTVRLQNCGFKAEFPKHSY